MAFISIILLVISALLLTYPYKLYRNYLIARRTGLPIILSPITPFQTLWHIGPALCGSFLNRRRWFRALDQSCVWQDKNSLHAELGTCFLVVSPGYNMLCTSDPVAIDNVFKNMTEFVKPEVFKRLDFFGPNIITVNGDAWSRHRRLCAPCFNERVSGFVWDESLRQARDMLDDWRGKPGGKSSAVVQDSGTVALHVLTAAAFGEQRDFREGVNVLAQGHELSFRDCLKIILKVPVLAAIVGQMAWLEKPIIQGVLSSRITKVQLALKEFKAYLKEAISRERSSPSNSNLDNKRPNLLNALVKASDSNNDMEKASSTRQKAMSDDELTGNMFMFAFAGHETTATTISYALALLAVYPDIQDWVSEELTQIYSKTNDLDYVKIFPKLKRTLAVMYETVRLFGVPPPWRDVKSAGPKILVTGTGGVGEHAVLPVPANTQVLLNVYACHTSPANFPDAETWDPKRWIVSEKGADGEQLKTNEKAFFGWGCGPRVCPGQSTYQSSSIYLQATADCS
jgi:cytochrome P450